MRPSTGPGASVPPHAGPDQQALGQLLEDLLEILEHQLMTAPTPPVRHRASRHDDHVGSLVMAVDRSVRSCGGRCAPADLLAGLDHATLPRNARGLDQGLLDIGTDRALRARGHHRSVDALDVNVRPLSLAYSDTPRCLSTSGCWCDASRRSVDVRLGDGGYCGYGNGARFIA